MHVSTPTLLIGAALFAAPLSAQHFKKTVLVEKLLSPTGIALEPSGNLLFTQLPDPGQNGKRNTVSRYDMKAMAAKTLIPGEPGPRNIAVTPNGDFYWTCDTVGVVFVFDANGQRMLARGLANPTGIAVSPKGRIYITEVPEPGKMMGKNRVAELTPRGLVTISSGEPEPADVVVDANENLYWTCKTAGVILRYDATTKTKSLVLDGLEDPQGLAMDDMGCLYFTEVPTPGKSGKDGGRNKVWRYDPATKALTLVSFGEPEPADVTVSGDGKSVYWTCTTAGVIVRGDELPSSAMITTKSSGMNGTMVDATLTAPMSEAGKMYLAATSFGLGPFPVDTRFVALSPDPLFVLTLTNAFPKVFQGYMGQLGRSSTAKLQHPVPPGKELVGLHLNTGYFVLDRKSPTGISWISNVIRVRIQ